MFFMFFCIMDCFLIMLFYFFNIISYFYYKVNHKKSKHFSPSLILFLIFRLLFKKIKLQKLPQKQKIPFFPAFSNQFISFLYFFEIFSEICIFFINESHNALKIYAFVIIYLFNISAKVLSLKKQ